MWTRHTLLYASMKESGHRGHEKTCQSSKDRGGPAIWPDLPDRARLEIAAAAAQRAVRKVDLRHFTHPQLFGSQGLPIEYNEGEASCNEAGRSGDVGKMHDFAAEGGVLMASPTGRRQKRDCRTSLSWVAGGMCLALIAGAFGVLAQIAYSTGGSPSQDRRQTCVERSSPVDNLGAHPAEDPLLGDGNKEVFINLAAAQDERQQELSTAVCTGDPRAEEAKQHGDD